MNSEMIAKKYPVLSFFSGAGFLDLGFLKRKFGIIWHNEYYGPFVQAFETGMSSLGYNGPSSKIQNARSIIDIGPNEIIKEAFNGEKPQRDFGIIGGPPCPDFSVGGKNRGQRGDQGRLSEVYINRIVELNPAFFVFENVPGLIRTAKHRSFLVNLMDRVSGRYALDINILNALDFGVPQDRERVFIVGFQNSWLRRNLPSLEFKRIKYLADFVPMLIRLPPKKFLSEIAHWFPWPEESAFKDAKNRFEWPVIPVPKGIQPEKPECPDELMAGTYVCNESRFLLPNSQEGFKPKSRKFHDILEGDVSRKSFKRLHRYRYSPAAAYGNNEVHLHPVLPRRLTVREAMMIQTVPDGYVMPEKMTLSDKFKTIGNGVPVKLAEAVAGAVSHFLERSSHEKV